MRASTLQRARGVELRRPGDDPGDECTDMSLFLFTKYFIKRTRENLSQVAPSAAPATPFLPL